MTKLISGKVAKVPSANVSADRYEFLDISEAEPDLGLPPISGWVLAANTNGTRFWTDPVSAAAGAAQFAYTAGSANVSILANVANTVLTISNFSTANLIEGINLYFTNARVVSAVTPLLTTANVIETSGNLYFTSARVNATVQPFLTTANVIETSGNLYFTADRVNATVQPFLTTANVVETSGNLYFTSARVNATVQPFLTTANVVETSGNLYFTNARVVSALIAGQNIIIESNGRISANVSSVSLTTDQVPEGVNNKYFTNARVLVGVTTGIVQGNITATGLISAGNITSNGSIIVGGQAGGYISGVQALYSNLIYANVLTIGNDVNGYITGVQRLTANIITANTLIINGNEIFSSEQGSNITVTRITANIWNGLYTANIIESPTNLFFTNARVVSALIAGQNIIIEANGRISANVSTTIANLQSQISNLFTDQISEGSVNLYYTNSRVISVVTPILTTANVIETSGNLYFTNSRVVSALTAGDNIIIEANGRISANVSLSIANLQSQIGSLTTDQITEGNTNKYFTNARVLVGITTGTVVGNITTTGTITANILSANTLAIGSGAGGTLSGIANITVTNTVTTNILSANTLSIGTGTGGTIAGATLISAETVSANIIRANTIILQNINVTSNIITGTVSSGTTTSNIIVADSVTSNTWNRLYTANVIETAGNLYFTNARVNTVIQPFLTTANVIETASNLYFTNSRVLVGITTGGVVGNIIVTGTVAANILSANTLAIGSGAGGTLTGIANLIVTNTVTTNILSANTLSIGSGAGGTIAGANLISATYIQGTNWLGLYTANIIESPTNIFFTNARVVSALIAGQNIIIEANGRISANATTAAALNLTTADVRETSNLYFTNTRVLVGITTGTVVGNITATGIVTANILSANILSVGAGEGGAITGIANLTATGTITANIINANIIILQNINVTSNIITGTVSSGTSTSNTILADSVTSNTWNRLYTANVIETSGNLYFTNARVLIGITTGTVLGNITATGTISANIVSANTLSAGTISANVVNTNTLSVGIGNGGAITGIANLTATGTITANIINANVGIFGSGFVGSLTGANLLSTITIQANSWLGLYTANVIESPTNLFFTNARVVSALIAGQNITIEANGMISSAANSTATVVAVLPYLTTSNVAEGSNLYFTTARVNATVQPFLTTANVIETADNLYFTNTRVLTAVNPRLTTANVQEAPNFVGFVNLYYTNARAVATITPLLTTANVIEDSSNLYFTNARVIDALVNSNVQVENLFANSTIYANALIIRNISVSDTVLLGSNVSGGAFSGNSLVVESVTANIWNGLYTANVIETAGNLYFTNARVVSALSAGQNIILASNGQISANLLTITAGENVVLEANGRLSVTLIPVTTINDSARFISTGSTTYTLGTVVNDPKNVLVIVEGLVQLPVVDYTVTGASLILADAPTVGTNIEVRFFGVDTINSARALSATVDTFVGDGSNVVYTLTSNPPNKNFVTVMIDGIYQQSDVYTLSGKNITFPEAPSLGSNIDIRVIGGAAGSTYNTRTFTANGNVSSFVLTEGFTRDTILVFENGVAQMPLTDYDVVNNSLVFTIPPADNVVVQVRELGISGISAANVIAAIRSLDQVTGNLIPTTNATKDLGSSSKTFNKLYLNQSGLVLSNVSIGATENAITITSSSNVTTTIASTQSISAKAFGLSLIFGG